METVRARLLRESWGVAHSAKHRLDLAAEQWIERQIFIDCHVGHEEVFVIAPVVAGNSVNRHRPPHLDIDAHAARLAGVRMPRNGGSQRGERDVVVFADGGGDFVELRGHRLVHESFLAR
jgi:hypothetical protein